MFSRRRGRERLPGASSLEFPPLGFASGVYGWARGGRTPPKGNRRPLQESVGRERHRPRGAEGRMSDSDVNNNDLRLARMRGSRDGGVQERAGGKRETRQECASPESCASR